MATTYITRGNLVTFTAVFADADGVQVDPDSATLRVSYVGPSGRTSTAVAMDNDSSPPEWRAEWDSSVALEGRVEWAVLALDPDAVDQGYFDLEANRANPGP